MLGKPTCGLLLCVHGYTARRYSTTRVIRQPHRLGIDVVFPTQVQHWSGQLPAHWVACITTDDTRPDIRGAVISCSAEWRSD
jgi:hypothetical protein